MSAPERGMSLWQIDDTIAQLNALRDEVTTDEERSVIDGQLAEWMERDVSKMEGCYGYIRHEQQLAEMARSVGQEAIMWQHRHENRAKRVTEMVQTVLERRGQKRVDLPFGGFTLRVNGGPRPMQPIDESKLPSEYKRVEFSLAKPAWDVLQSILEYTQWTDVAPSILRSMLSTSKVVVDTKLVRTALEAGEDVPGAKLGERGTSLLVR